MMAVSGMQIVVLFALTTVHHHGWPLVTGLLLLESVQTEILEHRRHLLVSSFCLYFSLHQRGKPVPVAVPQVLEAVSTLDPSSPRSRREYIEATLCAFETHMKLSTLNPTCVVPRLDFGLRSYLRATGRSASDSYCV